MKYDVISADCHIDLIWLPPDLFTANAPAALKDRMPFVTDGRARQGMGHQERRLLRADERHGLGRPALRAGQDPPLGPDGLGGDLRRRQEGHPPDDRSRIADQGPGPRRHPGRGSVRHPRRHQPDQRRRSRRRDAAHLQRVARRILQYPPRPFCRARLHPQPRHRRRGRRDRAGGAARRRARPRNLAARRHDAAVGPVVEPDVGCGRGERIAGAFPYDRQRRAARLYQASRRRWRSPPAPPASPASRCTCRRY